MTVTEGQISLHDTSTAASPQVVVIGAGITGLVVARELRRQNIDVTVLEARNRVGGRIHTQRLAASATPAELGAMRIPHDHARTIALCQDLRLPLEPFAVGTAGVQGGYGAPHHPASTPGFIGWERASDVWSRWERTVSDVRHDWERLSRKQFVDRYDRLSIRDFLRSRGWSGAAIEEYGIVTFTESTLATSVIQEFRETFSSAYETAFRVLTRDEIT